MKRLVLFVMLVLFLVPSEIFAHPHVFITSKVEVIFNDIGLEGISVEWEFDAMFSSFIIPEFDKNGSGKFEEQEVRKIEGGAFANLSNHNYFSYIVVGNKKHHAEEAKNFDASISGNRVIYNFFIPFELPFERLGNILKVGFFDETIFCDVAFADRNPYKIKAPAGIFTASEIVNNPDFWSINRAPLELKITVRRI